MNKVVLGDITSLKVDAIVNAANNSLLGGGGVDGRIHSVAGPNLLKECRTLHGCRTGEAKITKGYNLPAKYVIHTVGPVYDEHTDKESAELLTKCYVNCLNLAKKYGIHSIAFPSISTGIYGYDPVKAVPITKKAVDKWLKENSSYQIDVIFCCYKQDTYNLYMKQ